MRIFVMVDMEGISGICLSSQVSPGTEQFSAARRYATWDVNACVEGCLEAGATGIVVLDAHTGKGHNLVWDELRDGAEYIQGATSVRMPEIDRFDGLILLGYHAMAGTPGAILEHTMSSASWQNFWINGRKCGEIAIDAAIAGDHGVPTIMVSGDDKTCREAKRFVKGIVTAEVKYGLDVEGGRLVTAPEAHRRIRTAAAEAVTKRRSIKPYKVSSPVTMRLEHVSRGRVPIARPGVTVLDGRTFEVTGKTVEQALNAIIR